jgi:ABC-2 type transport system ATP-binding protein
MRQKLALAATLALDTALVILDEPTSNLDPTVRQEVIRLVREAQSAGRTVLFSSHVLSEVEQACDRVAILRRGELVHVQAVADLRRQHSIRARLAGPLPPVPPDLKDEIELRTTPQGELAITTSAALLPLLGWLSTLPLSEVHVQPVGLQAIYDRYHA